jgi:hypothetical protein
VRAALLSRPQHESRLREYQQQQRKDIAKL